MSRCNRCNNSMDDFNYRYNKGKCDSCKHKVALNVGLLVGLICLLIAVPISYVQYNYEVQKCSNLKVSETNYGFTHNVELDANYNQNCYRLRNHPLVIVEYLVMYPLLMSVMIGAFGYMIRRFK